VPHRPLPPHLPERLKPNFHELEYFVAAERGPEALTAVRELMLASLPDSVYPLGVHTVGADDAYLSPDYVTDTVAISIAVTPGTDYWTYVRSVEALLSDSTCACTGASFTFYARTSPRAVSGGSRIHRGPPRTQPAADLPQQAPSSAVPVGRQLVAANSEIAATRDSLIPFSRNPSYCLSFVTLAPWSLSITTSSRRLLTT
jgi:hypothetical protein